MKKILLLLLFLLLAGGGGWLLLVGMEREKPAISLAEELHFIGRGQTLSITAEDRKSGLRQVRVWVRQGQEMEALYARDFKRRGEVPRHEASLVLDAKGSGLEEGAATLIVAAQDHSLWKFKGNTLFREYPVVVDTVAPRISLLSTVHNVNEGGTGVVLYRLNEAPARSGVQVGETFFPGYPESAGGEGAYLAFFAVPPDAEAGLQVKVLALDEAGNEARRPFPARILSRTFPHDTMAVSSSFLGRKLPEFRDLDPGLPQDPLKAYLVVNGEWRRRNHETFRELTAESHPGRLWSGPFLQMPNSQNMAPFAVRRTYTYGGKIVDNQVHLGLDLASTSGAAVPAGNAGKVAFAGDLGIYGTTVLIDHGQGLFSSYSHLSGLAVQAGQEVERGATVGWTGSSGMAGGDHLHFAFLLSGEFVNPVEWLDEHWITDNVIAKLDALSSAPTP